MEELLNENNGLNEKIKQLYGVEAINQNLLKKIDEIQIEYNNDRLSFNEEKLRLEAQTLEINTQTEIMKIDLYENNEQINNLNNTIKNLHLKLDKCVIGLEKQKEKNFGSGTRSCISNGRESKY